MNLGLVFVVRGQGDRGQVVAVQLEERRKLGRRGQHEDEVVVARRGVDQLGLGTSGLGLDVRRPVKVIGLADLGRRCHLVKKVDLV